MTQSLLIAVSISILAGTADAQTKTAGRTRDVVVRGNVSIDVITEGRGPLIVLLPSLGRDSEEFDPVAAQIAAAGFRVLRPQPRGYGRSAGPMEKLTLHDYARDVAAVIERENAGPAIVAGHAFGHFVAKVTAVDFPKQVRAVVLIAAAQKNIDPEVRRWLGIATDGAQPESERIKYLQKVFFAPGHDPRPWLTGFHPAVQRAEETARDATQQSEYWSSGTAPLLDIQAEYDPYRPRSTSDELIQEFGAKRVSVVVVPNASHALPVENPGAVAAAIIAYARRL
jgi:pimeloyl-ACP methyl ester carboxylesterase